MDSLVWGLLGAMIVSSIEIGLIRYRVSKFDGTILANSLKISAIDKEARDLSREVRNLWATIEELQKKDKKKTNKKDNK